jgi:hypothetical protein
MERSRGTVDEEAVGGAAELMNWALGSQQPASSQQHSVLWCSMRS